jgi:hypothetical protein
MDDDDGRITPAAVGAAFWRWFWVGIGALAVLGGLTLGLWQAGWWFQSHDATRQAEITQNGYSNQTTQRQQVTANFATLASIGVQIAANKSNASLVSALKVQQAATASTICSDAAQVTATPLPASQAKWVAANCSDGTLSATSPDYQAGQPS